MTAPAIKINGGSPGVKASLSASSSYSATLDSTAGVRTVEWSILSTDETSSIGSYTLVTSGTVGQTVTFTTLGAGTAAILHVKVNAGIDTQTGIANSTTTEATCKFGVLLASGLWVGVAGEKMEHDATYGSTGLLNAGIRLADTLDVGQYDATYLTRTASAVLTNETAIDAISSIVEFTSTSTVPFGTKRTSSTTNGFVTVGQSTALSSGTALAGFGSAWVFLGEVAGGGAENYGLIGFAATDLTGGSEDTKAVLQARTAGAALATVAEFSGTAAKLPGIATGSAGLVAIDADGNLSRTASGSGADATAKYLTDASVAVNANDVPTQGMVGTLNFFSTAVPLKVGRSGVAASDLEVLRVRRTVTDGGGLGTSSTAGHIAWALPNGAGAETEVAREIVQLTSTVGPAASWRVQTMGGGTLADALTVKSSGIIQFHATDYAHNGYRLILDGSGNLSASVITEAEVRTALAAAAGDIAVNSQKITGLANGSSAQDAAAFGQIATAVNAAVSGTSGKVAKFTGTNAIGNSTISDDGTDVSITGSFTAGTGGFIGVSLNRATSGTFTLGGNITTLAATALAMTGIASVANAGSTIGIGTGTETAISIGNGTITTTTTGLLDTIYAGIANVATHGRQLRNTTASTAGVTVQRGPSDRWEGHARVSGADRAMYADFELLPRTSGAVDLTFKYNNSGSDNTAFRYTTSTSSQFTAALECSAFSCTLGSAGFFFDADAGGMYRGGSGGVQIYSAASGDPGVFHADVTGSTDPIRIWASGETKGATKAIACFGDGTSWTQRARIAGDGTWEGSVVRNTASKTSNYTAALYELVEYSVAGGTFTVTTPTPASGKTGQLLITKNIGSNGTPLSITTPSGNIDNAGTIKVAGGYACDTMVSDGSNGWLRISALRPWNFTATKTSAYTTAVGEVVKCDPSGGGFTVTLPPVPTTNTLREIDIIIKNVTSSTNTITIAPDGSDTIDGAASATITTARGVVKLLALPGGTDWLVL